MRDFKLKRNLHARWIGMDAIWIGLDAMIKSGSTEAGMELPTSPTQQVIHALLHHGSAKSDAQTWFMGAHTPPAHLILPSQQRCLGCYTFP